jgi:hypothetical protein
MVVNKTPTPGFVRGNTRPKPQAGLALFVNLNPACSIAMSALGYGRFANCIGNPRLAVADKPNLAR